MNETNIEWRPQRRERVLSPDGIVMQVLATDEKHPNPERWLYMLTDGFWYFIRELKPAPPKNES